MAKTVKRKVILETRCEFYLQVEGPTEEAIKKWARGEGVLDWIMDESPTEPSYIEEEGVEMRKVHGVVKIEKGDTFDFGVINVSNRSGYISDKSLRNQT